MNGTIINVPVDFDKVQLALPRDIDEKNTIAIRLKCRLHYENAYKQGNVIPSHVMNTLTILSKTPFYTKEKISINKDWQHLFANKKMQQQIDTIRDGEIDGDDIILEDENKIEPESLIHWFNESNTINDLASTIIEIALAEGFKPLGIFQDTYSEEMNFPTLFFGSPQPNEITKKFLGGSLCIKVTTSQHI